MKKILLAILVLALSIAGFTACEVSEPDNDSPADDNRPVVTGDLEGSAVDYLAAIYQDAARITPVDYEVISSLSLDGIDYTLEWTVDPADKGLEIVPGENNVTVIKVPQADAEFEYTLSVKITSPDGKSAEIKFKHAVPEFKVNTWQEYVDAKKDKVVSVQGIVTGLISKSATAGNSNNCIFLEDAEGGSYYAFGGKQDPIADQHLAIGMEVRVTGKKDLYNGTHELKDYAVKVINEELHPILPADYTEIYKNAAADLKDEALVKYQGKYVGIKGVTLEEVGGDKHDYYYFSLEGKKSYIRISSSTNPLSTELTAAFKEAHNHLGYTADVAGAVSVFNGAFYLVPVSGDAITNLQLPEKTPAEQIAFEKEALKFQKSVAEDKTFDLPKQGVTYTDVKIAWASSSESAVVDSEAGTLTVTVPDVPETITLTATLTCGAAEPDTKEFEVSLSKLETPRDIVNAAYSLAAGEALPVELTLQGAIISAKTYSTKYNNIDVVIVVEDMFDKPITCFRMAGDGADVIAVGDNITVKGTIKNYNGTIEFDSGCQLLAHQTPAEIMTAAKALAENTQLEGKNTLTGVITEVNTAYSEKFGNVTVTIQVGDQTIQCFRMKGDGADVIAAGDTLTVFGQIKNYKGTVEFDANCSIVTFTKAAGGEEPGGEEPGGQEEGVITIDFSSETLDNNYNTKPMADPNWKRINAQFLTEEKTQLNVKCVCLNGAYHTNDDGTIFEQHGSLISNKTFEGGLSEVSFDYGYAYKSDKPTTIELVIRQEGQADVVEQIVVDITNSEDENAKATYTKAFDIKGAYTIEIRNTNTNDTGLHKKGGKANNGCRIAIWNIRLVANP